jgi:hypothetical protein
MPSLVLIWRGEGATYVFTVNSNTHCAHTSNEKSKNVFALLSIFANYYDLLAQPNIANIFALPLLHFVLPKPPGIFAKLSSLQLAGFCENYVSPPPLAIFWIHEHLCEKYYKALHLLSFFVFFSAIYFVLF